MVPKNSTVFLWARNDKDADQSGSFITSLSQHIHESKMAAAKESLLNRFLGPMET